MLTLLAIPRYVPLLSLQLFSTRRSIAHSIVSSVLKNETVVETPEDVNGVLELCHVLIKDQKDSGAPAQPHPGMQDGRRVGPSFYLEREDVAEEQGWVARMVHLFRSDSLDVQFEACPFFWEGIRLLTALSAHPNGTKTLRGRRRAHAVHVPGPHHVHNQVVSAVQDEGTCGR